MLGDLVTPVVVVIRRVPRSFMDYDGGTVVAHRSAIMTDRTLTQHEDSQIIRDLFDLLHAISGQTDPKTVLAQIGSAVLKQFSYANCLSVLLRDGDGEWVAEFEQSRTGTDDQIPPSSTLLKRAVESLEVVSYLPDSDVGTASVVGLAGSVLMPLVSGGEAIGVLHVSSSTQPFDSDALAWLTIAGTHVTASLVAARRFRALARSEAELRVENTSLKSVATMARPIVGRHSLLKALSSEKVVEPKPRFWSQVRQGRVKAGCSICSCSQSAPRRDLCADRWQSTD